MMMKQKSILLALAVGFLLCIVGNLQAQDQLTGHTNLNVTLKPVLNISVTDANVNMPFTTSADYLNGVTVDKPNYLVVNSTNGFSVTVKADGDLTSGSASIPLGDFSILAYNGNAYPLDVAATSFENKTALNTTANPLFRSTSGILKGSVSVEFSATGGSDFFEKPSTTTVGGTTTDGATYTAELTYTIANL